MYPQSLLPEQIAEVARLKQYFPYRICYGAISPEMEFEANAVSTMRRPNSLARKGYSVFIYEVKKSQFPVCEFCGEKTGGPVICCEKGAL